MASVQNSLDSRLTIAADDCLARRVEAYLWSRNFPTFRDLKVSALDGIVTISGAVPTFYQKQVANQSCRRVAGVFDIVDAVDVLPSEPPSQTPRNGPH